MNASPSCTYCLTDLPVLCYFPSVRLQSAVDGLGWSQYLQNSGGKKSYTTTTGGSTSVTSAHRYVDDYQHPCV